MPSLSPLVRTRNGGRVRAVALAALLLSVAGLAAAGSSPATATSTAGDSCAPPPGVTCVLDVPYSDDGSPVHTLDVYYPTDLTARASVVFIHGGRWMNGSSRSYAAEAAYFAENGFAAFSVNYTLAQGGAPSWPQVRTDVETATAWVMAHAADYHGDNTRVGVLGGSAGGHLAALVDTAGSEVGATPLATVTWSGVMDTTITFDRGNRAARRGLGILLGCRPNECQDTYVDASPVSHVTSDDGSMLLFHSSDEAVPVAGAREMKRALTAAGVPNTLIVFRHSTEHSRTYECDEALVEGQTGTVIDDSLRWLGDQLSQPTTPTGSFCNGRG